MTLAAITMTAPEAASPVQMYRATYSPDDNKLRLYAVSRLDPETYKKVHDAGFRWAPKQALFVAPAWTPGREDVLLSLAGEIEDEDSTLAERQEARAERFTGYSGKRASESAQALDEVERLAAMIPPGQPILVGHHSERRARRDAQRIENGMKRAVMLFERAEYWEERARSALLHAKYKERPDVRWRRIKKIEADLRKAEKTIAQSQKYLTMWRAESLDLNMAKLISSHDRISACFPLDTYPRPAEKSQYEGSRSLWSALDDDIITTEQAREIAIRCHERQIQHQQRWVNHYQNRLIYERAMLGESGGVVTRTQDFEPGGQVFSRGEWLTIIRVNKSNGAVSSVTTPNYSFLGYSGTMKVTPDRITDYKAPSAEEAAVASQAAKRPPVVNYPGEGFWEMTKAQWAALPRDCKAVRSVAEAEDHGAYRFPVMQQSGCFRRCGFVSGSAVAINPRWSCRSTAASRHGRQSRKPVRTRSWSLRLKSNWHSIRRKQSEAGMHAGVTGWQSMTWKPCSGSGASVFRHCPEWNAGSGRICRSGRLLRKPVLQQERPVTLSVRWSGGWCRTNSGRQRDAATITQITRKQPE